MLYPTIFPFSLNYLKNAEYMINNISLMLKSILMIPNNFIYIWS